MPEKKKRDAQKRVIVLRENNNLLLACVMKGVLKAPSDPEEFQKVVASLRETFNAPEAVWETLTVSKYEKKFPIVNRLIAESFEFDDAKRFFSLMEKP